LIADADVEESTMTIHLDHTIVPSRDKEASAKQLAQVLGVACAPAAAGPFYAVYVNEGLTLDFIDTDEAFPIYHFCFRVEPATFESILTRIRAAGIPFRSTVRGPVDSQVDANYGNVYWNAPDGHQWEMLTVSYARPAL
jgi:catechol 2,3-dioxygenase-like lactoylglutathione lyase family enzyme